MALAGEQAGVQLSIRRHPGAMAVATERFGNGTDETDFATAIVEAIARIAAAENALASARALQQSRSAVPRASTNYTSLKKNSPFGPT